MNDEIVYQARLHWIVFMGPIILFSIATYLTVNFLLISEVSFIVCLIAIAWFLIMLVTYLCSSLTIKSKHVILRTGLIVRETVDIPIGKIESIDIRQSILGSLLRYGSLVITGTGGTRQVINFVNKPLTCRRYIEQVMHS